MVWVLCFEGLDCHVRFGTCALCNQFLFCDTIGDIGKVHLCIYFGVCALLLDLFGLESLMIDHKLTKVGKVFFTAYYDEIKSLKGGKALAGGSSFPPIIAHHDESNVSLGAISAYSFNTKLQ